MIIKNEHKKNNICVTQKYTKCVTKKSNKYEEKVLQNNINYFFKYICIN